MAISEDRRHGDILSPGELNVTQSSADESGSYSGVCPLGRPPVWVLKAPPGAGPPASACRLVLSLRCFRAFADIEIKLSK